MAMENSGIGKKSWSCVTSHQVLPLISPNLQFLPTLRYALVEKINISDFLH